jgi:hypothetical protein
MKQFYETYVDVPKLATLLRELSWSKHLLLLPNCKSEKKKGVLSPVGDSGSLVASRT